MNPNNLEVKEEQYEKASCNSYGNHDALRHRMQPQWGGINNEEENPSLPIEPTGVVGETAIEGHIIDENAIGYAFNYLFSTLSIPVLPSTPDGTEYDVSGANTMLYGVIDAEFVSGKVAIYISKGGYEISNVILSLDGYTFVLDGFWDMRSSSKTLTINGTEYVITNAF